MGWRRMARSDGQGLLVAGLEQTEQPGGLRQGSDLRGGAAGASPRRRSGQSQGRVPTQHRLIMSNPQLNGVATAAIVAPPAPPDPGLFLNRELSWLDFNERV